jgi:hypothetical protein
VREEGWRLTSKVWSLAAIMHTFKLSLPHIQE